MVEGTPNRLQHDVCNYLRPYSIGIFLSMFVGPEVDEQMLNAPGHGFFLLVGFGMS